MKLLQVGALAALGLAVGASDAVACHNGVEIRVVPLTRLVAQASQALTDDQPERAVTLAGRSIRRLRTQRSTSRSRMLMERSKAVLATATVRLDGAVDREEFRVARNLSTEEREAAVRWAVGILEHAFSGGGSLATARYAEALARFPAQHRRARSLLQQLHQNDVIPDAYAYNALAELSEDAEHRREALELCRRRAGTHARSICRAGPR